ncbi:DUF4935 domain-containing protein [Vibrio parahaemolyticus]|uniref:PIN domain-containing protein n=1 Tax=Vibrio parahaemolyticus TaxID=670 RepID=UPI00038E48C9|nr:PIN domain-containing protein [Vibrio parahaemolyticus]EJG0922086.1 DUF4935 domain-containing protein [Vibrio parahaemolyticus O1:K68]EJG0931632.1 DUF4935 domain-containing protein [Vibrio parahaemolyticus O1]EJG0945913.1 DUF4935 domain-containing protein [Vibrio parahaemolyticus O10]EQM49518.1 hypothetical protein D051_3966 [Vibrio parahaemolyticus VPCR-2010]EGQ9063817.1 hypothetical protein [Vibrio parahaemolyticus]
MSKVNVLGKVFPDAASIFTKENASLEDSLKNGIIVLDTNTLLFPFNVNKQGLKGIVGAYEKLVSEERLFVPAHVAREFAKNRAAKLGEIYVSVSRMANSQRDLKRYPLLSDIEDYQEVVELQKSIGETEKKIKDKIKSVLDTISGFERNDPVSSAYTEIFNSNVVYQHVITDDKLDADFKYRSENKLPPGYKDGSKTNNAEGDLIVWHSILELGQKHKKDLVFISSDGKPDWQYNVDKKPFQARYELIDEYRRVSDGKSFHIAPLSHLLEVLEASEGTVQRVEWLEHIKPVNKAQFFTGDTYSLDEKLENMKSWFFANYEPPENNLPYESREGGYFYIWGGPYELQEVLFDEFGQSESENLINICIEQIEEEYGDIEWSGVPRNDSIWVSVHPDYETCNDIGASGMFQVISVEDENGNDLSSHIDSGKHYSSLRDVLKELSLKLGINVDGELV